MGEISAARKYLEEGRYEKTPEIYSLARADEEPYYVLDLLFKIREDVTNLCRVGNTETYDNPRDILALFNEAGIDTETDVVGAMIFTYVEIIEGILKPCNGSDDDGQLLEPQAYEKMVQMAKDEDTQRNTIQ